VRGSPANPHAPAPCYREAHKSPTSPRSGVAHHRKPTDETELCGTWRHGRYDGYKTGWPAVMRVSWAFECSSNYGFGGDRTPEKRKVGGSTPPLTTRTPFDLRKRRFRAR